MSDATIRSPLMSGHCAHMTLFSAAGKAAHARCAGGQRANPDKIFQPCPCSCHYPDPQVAELFECGECGKIIIEAVRWPLDEDGDVRYTHMDWVVNDDGEVVSGTGRALGEDCNAVAVVSRNASRDKVRDCSRCGEEFTPAGRERICGECRAAEAAERKAEEDDEFASMMAEMDDVLDEDAAFDAMLAEFDDLDEDED